MGLIQKVCLCLLLTTILALNASGQRNRYNYNNNNNNNYNYNNNQNSGYRGSSVCDDPENPCEEGIIMTLCSVNKIFLVSKNNALEFCLFLVMIFR